MKKLMVDNIGRIVTGLIAVAVLGAGAYVTGIASEETQTHNLSQSSHAPLSKSIQDNSRHIEVLSERVDNARMSAVENFARQETRATRIEAKIDRILEKL